jgi:hypothetical protein
VVRTPHGSVSADGFAAKSTATRSSCAKVKGILGNFHDVARDHQ